MAKIIIRSQIPKVARFLFVQYNKYLLHQNAIAPIVHKKSTCLEWFTE